MKLTSHKLKKIDISFTQPTRAFVCFSNFRFKFSISKFQNLKFLDLEVNSDLNFFKLLWSKIANF